MMSVRGSPGQRWGAMNGLELEFVRPVEPFASEYAYSALFTMKRPGISIHAGGALIQQINRRAVL